MNSSQNELNTFFSESKKPSGGILKSPERKSPSPRKVQFKFSNYPANQSANAKSSQSKQTPDVLSSFWLKAYKTPLGKWGFVFLLLGLLGMIATTQGSILFYGAFATSIIGSTLLGINFFRVSRPPIQQVIIPTSFVPTIS